MTTAQQAVANGARWLDTNFPGWVARIDVKTLNLREGESCICGQVFGGIAGFSSATGYDYARNHLFAQANGWIKVAIGEFDADEDDYAAYVSDFLGFSVPHDRGWVALEKEWKRLIRARQRLLRGLDVDMVSVGGE